MLAIMQQMYKKGIVVPAFNVPYLPMMEPIVRALRDTESFGMIEVARLEWEKFQARSLEVIRETYEACKDERYSRLHLDHIPVIDEDGKPVDYLSIIRRAIELGFDSVMVDGSRLPLEGNIAATKSVVEIAHAAGVPVEAELGAIVGHENGPMPDYEELFKSGKGFTDVAEAKRFVDETNVDWLSIAFGNVHGAISQTRRHEKKVQAKLDIDHLKKIRAAVDIPLVLHGGSGISSELIREAIANGIAKINIATELRQSYENGLKESSSVALQSVYDCTVWIVTDHLKIAGRRPSEDVRDNLKKHYVR